MPAAPDEIAVEADRAATSKLGVGSTIMVTDGDGRQRELIVVGLYAGGSMTDSGYLMTADGAQAVDPYATAFEVLVQGVEGTDPAELAAAVAAELDAAIGGDDSRAPRH